MLGIFVPYHIMLAIVLLNLTSFGRTVNNKFLYYLFTTLSTLLTQFNALPSKLPSFASRGKPCLAAAFTSSCQFLDASRISVQIVVAVECSLSAEGLIPDNPESKKKKSFI